MEGIRVAVAVGSPTVTIRIGGFAERYSAGGLEVHIKEVIRVLKALRGPALDAGIKFAMEVQGGTEAVQSAVSFNWSLLFIKKSTTLKAVLLTDTNTQP